MKKLSILSVVLIALLAVGTVANAQFRPKKPTTGGGTTPNPTTTTPNPTPTGTGGTGTTGGGNVKPGKTIDTARSATGKEYGGTVKPSLRPQYGFDTKNTQVADRTPLSYEHLREEDVVFSHFIWREIDAREKMNKVFSYPGKDGDADQRFFSILLDAMRYDSVWAFSSEDDRFTTPLIGGTALTSFDSVMSTVGQQGSELDTQYVANVFDQNVIDTFISRRTNPFAPKPDSIYTFRIKEQVMFDKESSRLFTRIIGIAPIAKIAPTPGAPSTPKLLFWVYYPDLRKTLSKKFVYNGKNVSGRMTWEDLFESRFFSSYIVKSSVDNPTDQSLRELIKDPLFRLLEGENIKEKIFNYEQNLWAY
jgi:gliding motility associated protien GldN